MNGIALLSGLLFSLGVALSGMVNPAKVTGFLDVGGRWDPSLAWVMIGAIGVNLIPMRLAMRRTRSVLLGCPVDIPKPSAITRRLVVGSILFGVGWGLSGVCPGPALVNLATLHADRWMFFAFMLGGMALYELWNARIAAKRAPALPAVSVTPVDAPAPALCGRLGAQPAGSDLVVLLPAPLAPGAAFWIDLDGQSRRHGRVDECHPGRREGDAGCAVVHLHLESHP